MSRFSISGRSSAAATATLPAVTLYAGSSGGGRVREIHIWNTTATAFVASVRKFSTAGTRGSAVNSIAWDGGVVQCSGADASTGTPPTLVNGIYRQVPLPAAVGGGVVFTFDDSGLYIPAGTGNGIGIICPVGTGQVFDYSIDWDE